MSRNRLSVLAVAVCFLFAFAAFGQEQRGGGDRRNQSFTERYGAQLNLTDAQKKQIDELDEKYRKDNAAFFEGYMKTMGEYREARQANDQAKIDALKPKVEEAQAQATKLRSAHEENIAKSFNADQKAAWQKIKDEREARMKERQRQQ